MQKVSLYLPNEIKINEVKLGNTYYENNKKIDDYPKKIDFIYIPDSYIPRENEARIYKMIYGPDADIRETYTGFKLNYIKEFPYELTANFNSLPNDINREIRMYLI